MSKQFYITTTLPYVNAEPHVGFAMELIRADVIARWRKSVGDEVFFNTGTDEHGSKLWQAAQKEGKEVKQYVDEYAEKFKGLVKLLGISEDINFVRTTDAKHEKTAQEFWRRCQANGFIYKKAYQIKYCVGCELEKTDSELDDKGECPLHPGRAIELIDEENYFFKFSAFQQPLLDFYTKHPKFVLPDFRFNEIKAFVERGLEDFSISRLKSKMPWGVAVPDDSDQVMYVWFDALVNYISTLGWPDNQAQFEAFWVNGTPTQYCGKDNLRQQSAMWQAMLMSVNLPNTHQVVINGFYTGEGGIKMSKSIGNVVNPYDVVAEYGVDALRYFVTRETSSFDDSPFTMERFKDTYNANLANGLGNLVSRIMKMAETNLMKCPALVPALPSVDFQTALSEYDTNKAASVVWEIITKLDKKIQDTQPFKLVKTDQAVGVKIIEELVTDLYTISQMLNPLMPETAKIIQQLIEENKAPAQPLFLRKD
ncbi:MAG: methionine--tRNA ligase [Candidatus Vogelbacteria bacterium]|nr:methionine--tRNA ligase [Candidatus Vogelbacteria bacterium]